MFYRPLKKDRVYWMTLFYFKQPDVSIALYGDKEGRYYKTYLGNFICNDNMVEHARILVRRSDEANYVEEYVTGIKIPRVVINVEAGKIEDEYLSDGEIRKQEVNSILGDTSHFIVALAVDRQCPKTDFTDETYLLREATTNEMRDYTVKHSSGWYAVPNSWEEELRRLIVESSQIRYKILENSKAELGSSQKNKRNLLQRILKRTES